MATLGLWLGPSLAIVIGAAAGNRWLGWFRPPLRRRESIRRIADRLARLDLSVGGAPWQYDRYLEHYLGGRRWDEEWDKANEQAKDGSYYDGRSPAPRFFSRFLHRL